MQQKYVIEYWLQLVMMIPLCFMSLSLTKPMHPYFVGVTEVHIHTAKKSVEVSCKLFTDDLQQALHKNYKFKGRLTTNDTACKRLVQQYINTHLSIYILNEKQHLKFAGYEIVEEACWCYFESNYTAEPNKVVVNNTLLYDHEEVQTNFIHCFLDKERKSFKLSKPASKAVFEY